jgi:two-component system phosphate regulon sensor histidine kinase PhoR
VSDTGVGIPDEALPRLTERFYRVDKGRDRTKGGTGLGLAIVKHVLQRHEAHLEVQSELGAGSTFTCHFPVSRIAE